MTFYYSTQSFLEWCFNHYFFGRRHYSWLAAPFYPYKQKNPSSSNPYELYGSLYRPWVDNDRFDYFIESKRIHVRKGVIAQQLRLGTSLASDLKDVCERIDPVFLLPVVYRVNIARISARRLIANSGSALTGSNEYVIAALRESEFDILFLDFDLDTDFSALRSAALSKPRALNLMKGRCS